VESRLLLEDLPVLKANALFVLKAMVEKWRQDKRRKGFCSIGARVGDIDRGPVIPDRFFADWVERLTLEGFRACVDGLAELGLVQLFAGGAFAAFYEITEKAKRALANSQMLAAPVSLEAVTPLPASV
jgi:hypothetical protein